MIHLSITPRKAGMDPNQAWFPNTRTAAQSQLELLGFPFSMSSIFQHGIPARGVPIIIHCSWDENRRNKVNASRGRPSDAVLNQRPNHIPGLAWHGTAGTRAARPPSESPQHRVGNALAQLRLPSFSDFVEFVHQTYHTRNRVSNQTQGRILKRIVC
jgi:hypothetical protein